VTGDKRHAFAQTRQGRCEFLGVIQKANEEMSTGHRAVARTAKAVSAETKEAAENAAKHVICPRGGKETA